jgi:glutamine transport system substrate-binding protein
MRFFALFSLIFLMGCEQNKTDNMSEKNSASDQISVAISSDYEPFAFIKDGNLTGFDVVFIDAIAKKFGKKPRFHDIAFQDILKTVKAAKVDLAIAAIARNNTREKDVDFSIPYHTSVTVLVVPLASSVSSMEDLKGKIIGVEKGTTYEEYLKEHHNNTEITSLEKFSDLIQSMRDGKCGAILTGYAEAYSLQANMPDIKIIPIDGTAVQYCMAFPKGSALIKVVNEQIESMIANGDLHALEKQFFRNQIEG